MDKLWVVDWAYWKVVLMVGQLDLHWVYWMAERMAGKMVVM